MSAKLTLTYASVCSGTEAFGHDLEAMGFECVFHAEIEPHASAVLRHHYPNIPNYGDFTQIAQADGPQPTQPVRLLMGGTPCQDFSIAGLRAGIAGDKGNLTLEFLLLARRLGAQWILFENVPGVLSSVSHHAPDSSPPDISLDGDNAPADGSTFVVEDEYEADESHAFNSFLAGLQELGYGFAVRTLDAKNFGVPQRRRRVFVVGYLGDWRPAAAVLFEPESLLGYPAKGALTGQDLTGTLSIRATAGGGLGTDFDCAGGLVAAIRYGEHQQDTMHFPDGLMSTLPAGSNNNVGHYTHTLVSTEQPMAFDTTQITSKANMSRRTPGDPCHTLPANGHAPAIAFTPEQKVWNVAFNDINGSRPDRPLGGLYVNEVDTHKTLHAGAPGETIVQSFTEYAGNAEGATGLPFLTVSNIGKMVNNQTPLCIEHSVETLKSMPLSIDLRNSAVTVDGPTMAIQAGGIGEGRGMCINALPHVAHNSAVRRLLPVETEALMGWGRGWTAYGVNAKGVRYALADGPRYRLCGNGWVRQCILHIAERLLLVDGLMR